MPFPSIFRVLLDLYLTGRTGDARSEISEAEGSTPSILFEGFFRNGSWFDGPDLKQRPGRGCNILRGQFPFS